MQKIITRLSLSIFSTAILFSAVNAQTMCTMQYAPVCGQPAPICNRATGICMNEKPVTYGNTCVMEDAGATLLYSGECGGGMVETRPLARIETTEFGAPSVGNSSELRFVCEASSYMSISRSYNAYQGATYVYNADTANAQTFSKTLQVDLGATYKVYCGDDNGNEATATYSTPDYLAPQVVLSAVPVATTNTGSVLYGINLQVINGPLKQCDIFVNGVFKQTLASGVLSVNMTLPSGMSQVYAGCKYSNNSVAIGSIQSNTLSLGSNSSVPTTCPKGMFTDASCVCPNGGSPVPVPSGTRVQQYTCDTSSTYFSYCSVFDVDGDGLNQALIDGVLIHRALNEYISDTGMLTGITFSSNSTRTSASAIREFVKANIKSYDVDRDGRSLAGIDGLLITRYMLGLTGAPLVSDISVPTGVTGEAVVANIKSNCSQSGTTMCTAVYKPVCGRARNSCDGLTSTESLACRPAPAVYTTYSNRCHLEAAGAIFVSEGVCGTTPATTTPNSVKVVSNLNSAWGQGASLSSGESRALLGSYSFSGSGKMNSIKFSRTGVATNNTVSNLYLVDQNGNFISGPANLAQSDGSLSFFRSSGLFTVIPGSVTWIELRGDIAPDSLGQSLGLDMVSYSVDNNVISLRLNGPQMNITTAGSLEYASIIGDKAEDLNLNQGSTNVSVWKGTLSVNRPVFIRDVMFTFAGSLPVASSPNFSMYVDGIRYASVARAISQSDSIAILKFGNISDPAGVMSTGDHVLDVRADISSGAGRSFRLSLDTPSSLWLSQNNNGAITGTVGGVAQYGTGGLISIVGSGATVCPVGNFTDASCVCPNGGSPNIVPSGTRIQQYTCGVSAPVTKNTCPTGNFYDTECKCPLGTSMQTVNASSCSGSLLMCAQVMAYSCVATPGYETPPYVPEIPIYTTPTVCIEPTVNLGVGSRGSAVTDVQKFLNTKGYLSNTPTGYFGSATRAAVIKFQSENGISTTGYVGQLTRAQLRTKSCEPLIPIPDTPVETSATSIPTSSNTNNVISSAPASAAVVSTINVIATAPGFSVSSVSVENGNKFTIVFKALDLSFDSPHYVKLVYKNSSKSCILTASFIPTAGKTYNLIRSAESSCILGGVIGALSEIDHIEIVRQ